MRKIFLLSILVLAAATGYLGAQDTASSESDEKINRLNGYIQDLREAQAAQNKRIDAIAKEIEALREQAGQAGESRASAEDLRKLAEQVRDLDKKREADKELILKEIESLAKKPANSKPRNETHPPATGDNTPSTPGGNEKGYDYVVQSGDTVSSIAKSYRDQNIKVTVDQILKANPGLDPKNLRVGKKIFIPAPAP